jgi:pyruvate/2-oxoglutarate dehydrogenase complex dihydrolipoamide dehydrogenase (E3) component/uncharacterized membrane protein YdjX (TVP38/TMEM64 family)
LFTSGEPTRHHVPLNVESACLKAKYIKILIAVSILTLIALSYRFGWHHQLSLENLREQQTALSASFESSPVATMLVYFAIYVTIAALSIPGAAVLTIAAGVIFGFWTGVLIVSFASTIGATLAFWTARWFFRNSVQKKFGSKLEAMNQGIARDGASYLFTLRLVPLVPFFVINLGMGLTTMPARVFFVVSQLGMLAGTAVYVNAGTQLSRVSSLKDIMSPALLGSFLLLGIFPHVARWAVSTWKVRKLQSRYNRPKSFGYNIVVIGAGSGGLVASYIAAAVKAKVALIEKHQMGGDCLNTGCVPSKALIRSAKAVALAPKAQALGLKSMDVKFDFKDVMARVRRVIKTIEPHDSVQRYEGLGVECIKGEAKILSPWEVGVGDRRLTTKNIIVATGGRPFVPSISGMEGVRWYTSDNIWELDACPARMVVVGAGPIGVELAQAFQRLGSAVTLIEQAPRVLVREDEDVSKLVHARLVEGGVTIHVQSKMESFVSAGSSQKLICRGPQGELKVEFDTILFALGREANVEGFGLEELGVALDERRRVASDRFMATNHPNIFVCGDVTGELQFTHVASHEAWYASVNALFRPWKKFAADYRVIPMVTFTDPEVARVGLNELEAKRRNVPFETTLYGIDDLDRAIADEDAEGFVKVLTEPGRDTILGATIVGAHAGELLAEFVLAMKYKIGLNKILGTIHAYPTFAEANKYAAGVWKRAHAPQRALEYLKRFHAWNRR